MLLICRLCDIVAVVGAIRGPSHSFNQDKVASISGEQVRYSREMEKGGMPIWEVTCYDWQDG